MIPSLLDTDTISLFRKHHAQVSANALLYTQQFGQLTFSEVSYFEVTRGLKAIQATTQLIEFEQFCQHHRILPFTHNAAVHAADIWADLKQRGQLIGDLDVLIAAVALSEGLAVVTRNTRHFGRIAGLTVIDWTQ
jgi:tRNA(fMet)-specific endonuclease VapC